jgi:glycosyltransferase involved in cell wall biosynthesis
MDVVRRSTADASTHDAAGAEGHSASAGHVMLSIVIPAYNEERGLADIIERTLAAKDAICAATATIRDVELIVVDDGSTDRTPEIARAYARVTLVRHGENKGYGSALKTGFEAAHGTYIGFLDADGTYPPEQFPRLCRSLEQERADIVIGSRMSGSASAMPLPRYVGNKLFARLLSWIIGRTITDTASGMRVFKRSILPTLLPLPDGLHLTPAMSTRALHEGLKIVEVPIQYSERVGHSKLNPVADGFRFLSIIVGIARLYNPLKFFGAAGLFMLVLGCWLGLDPITYYLRAGRVEDTEIYRLFTIMVLFVTGINLMSFGAFANYVVEMIHGKELYQHGFLGRYLLNRTYLHRSGWTGGLLMVTAPVLNHRAIVEYVTTGRIDVHWVYILTGATLFLVGLQLVMGSILVGILQEVKASRGIGGTSRIPGRSSLPTTAESGGNPR